MLCSYQIPTPFNSTRFCRQHALWLVEYTTPDDGKGMRQRASSVRCKAHTHEKFFPRGTSQIVVSRLAALAAVGEG